VDDRLVLLYDLSTVMNKFQNLINAGRVNVLKLHYKSIYFLDADDMTTSTYILMCAQKLTE